MAKSQTRTKTKKVRYAVVGLGHIAQVAVLPAFANAAANSTLVAAVSDDATKRRAIGRRYRLTQTYDYAQYDRCLEQVDAVYIALPNSLHEEYTVRAARAGVHVLCEKPLAVTAAECGRMIDACRAAGVRLMTAYRLHFDPANLAIIDLVRSGQIGEPKYFTSSFSMTVRRGNIRTDRDLGGGTLYDIGVYCINAARYLFGAEPTEVMAMSIDTPRGKLAEIDESTAAILRFEGNRLATFVTSFDATDVASYRIVGTKGQVHMDPAYEYAEGLVYTVTVGQRRTRKRLPRRDQFAPELVHFSDCILNDREPEPSGEEGLQDVRIVQALYASAASGRAVKLPPYRERQRPSGRQRMSKAAVTKPKLVKAKSASVS